MVWFTCDGPATHQAMLKLLGAQLSADNLQAYFPHPCDANEKVYIFVDRCLSQDQVGAKHLIRVESPIGWRWQHHQIKIY